MTARRATDGGQNLNSHIRRLPLVVAADMGYGHLRSAWSLADALGTEVLRFDAPPLAEPDEKRTWDRARWLYEFASRASQVPVVGRPFGLGLDAATRIEPLSTGGVRARAPRSVHTLAALCRDGLCRGLLDLLKSSGRPLLTTFYAPAIAADLAGIENVNCVVTDSDIHRIWAPLRPAQTRIYYLVPSDRAVDRLVSYGVPRGNIELTGFPLPPELTEPDRLRSAFASRLGRLGPEADTPPLVTFAVGGAGAQTIVFRRALPGLGELLERNEIRLALVAGVRERVAERFEHWLRAANLIHHLGESIEILWRPEFRNYYLAFNDLLSRTDVLWTKPSELVFYAALGIPLLLAPPVGDQERCNLHWAVERGARPSSRVIQDGLPGVCGSGSRTAPFWRQPGPAAKISHQEERRESWSASRVSPRSPPDREPRTGRRSVRRSHPAGSRYRSRSERWTAPPRDERHPCPRIRVADCSAVV